MGDPDATAPPLPPIDLDAAATALAGWFGQGVHDLRRPSAGYSNETLLAGLDDGTEVAIRLGPARPGVFRDYDLDLQYGCMELAGAHGIPVPPLLGREPGGDVLGRPFFVMGAVPGRVPGDNPPYTFEGSWVLDLDHAGQRSVAESGIDAMAAVHRIPRSAWEPAVAARVQVGLDAQIAHWEDCLAWGSGGRPEPECQRGLAYLRAHRHEVADVEPALCWGDARIGNIIYGDDLRPAAVLDWEMACVGDPVTDLGWWLLLERSFGPALGQPAPPGFPGRDEVVARWEAATGRAAANLGYYEVLAGFRYAVIMVRMTMLLIEDGIFGPETDFDRTNQAASALIATLDELEA